MKKTLIALSLATMSLPALAQDKKAPAPDFTISGNFGLTSDYRFRGISQSNKKPAIQGGVDFAHKSGLYLGNWNSSVSEWTAPNSGGIEMDIYGGFKTEIAGIGLDLGAIYYYYPGAKWGSNTPAANVPAGASTTSNHWNTREIYIGLGYGPLSFKTSRTMGDRYFGLGKGNDTSLQRNTTSSSKGTLYYDLTFAQEVASKTTLKVHAGLLDLNNRASGVGTIKDYSVGVFYDFEGWVFGLSYVTTSGVSSSTAATTFFTTTDGKNTKLYGSTGILSLTKAF